VTRRPPYRRDESRDLCSVGSFGDEGDPRPSPPQTLRPSARGGGRTAAHRTITTHGHHMGGGAADKPVRNIGFEFRDDKTSMLSIGFSAPTAKEAFVVIKQSNCWGVGSIVFHSGGGMGQGDGCTTGMHT